MVIALDFDGTLVDDSRPYSDLKTPLRLMPWAKEALAMLRRAGHTLILYSARANRALREDPDLDPLVRSGARPLDRARWERDRPLHEARFIEMLLFVAEQLPGIFDAIDDGQVGKVSADVYIDDRALRYGRGSLALDWRAIARMYGQGPALPTIRAGNPISALAPDQTMARKRRLMR